jgi:hypothetical protein
MGKLPFQKSEKDLAKELLRVLDGVSIRCATNALDHAIQLLSTTQVVDSESSLLLIDGLLEQNPRDQKNSDEPR